MEIKTKKRAQTSSISGHPAAGWLDLLSHWEKGEEISTQGEAPVPEALLGFAIRSSLLGLLLPTAEESKRAAASKFEEAKAALKSGMHADVLRLLSTAAVFDPRTAKYSEAIATEAFSREQLALADAASLRALQLQPHHAPSHALRAEILFELRRPDLAMLHLLLSIELSSAEATQIALARCYKRCVKIWPQANWGFGDLARILTHRGHRDKAINAFVRAVSRFRAEPLTRTLIDLCSDAPIQDNDARRPLDLPMVLISQIQRSGGTLLAQLFDGHPEMYVHPHELQIGKPLKWDWPSLDLNQSPRGWLHALFEASVTIFLAKGGYAKGDHNSFALKDRKPFTFSLDTLCTEFLRLSINAQSQRQIVNAYLTAFFIAWRNHQASGKERFFTGFCPRLILYGSSVARFFKDYPDGHLVSCIRNPISWYASASRHHREYASVSKALELWVTSTNEALSLARSRPKQVHLLTYDALTKDTEKVMMRLAKDIGITFDRVLLMPTYLGDPILPNSSFEMNEYGVHQRSLDQRELLSSADLAEISRVALPLYQEAEKQIASV